MPPAPRCRRGDGLALPDTGRLSRNLRLRGRKAHPWRRPELARDPSLPGTPPHCRPRCRAHRRSSIAVGCRPPVPVPGTVAHGSPIPRRASDRTCPNAISKAGESYGCWSRVSDYAMCDHRHPTGAMQPVPRRRCCSAQKSPAEISRATRRARSRACSGERGTLPACEPSPRFAAGRLPRQQSAPAHRARPGPAMVHIHLIIPMVVHVRLHL